MIDIKEKRENLSIFAFSDPGGGSEVCEVVQILKALWRFRARPLTQHSQLITALQTPSNYRPSHRARHISFE